MSAVFSHFDGKVCVVTGAASGIGRALTLKLAQAGAVLALSDRNESELTETIKIAGLTHSNRVLSDIFDMADATAIVDYAPRVEAALGPADYVFNVAGLTRVGDFEHTPLDAFEAVMDVNFYGVVRMSKAFLSQLKMTKGGLVNISSIFGVMTFPGQAHYCASKFAVRGFSETLAQELADSGVSVSSVHPGGVATNVARNAIEDHVYEGTPSREERNARFDKAAITTPERAAEIILKGTLSKKRRIIVGADAKIAQLLTRLFPVAYPKILRVLKSDIYDN